MQLNVVDFPHPLGPTTVVIPWPSFMTSLLAKDLKPCIFISDIYTKSGVDACINLLVFEGEIHLLFKKILFLMDHFLNY